MKRIVIIISALFIISNLIAYTFEKAGIRNFSMGKTGISQSYDGSASVYNPALLAHLSDFSLLTDNRAYLYGIENDNLDYNAVILTIPIGNQFSTAFSSSIFQSDLYNEIHVGLHAGSYLFGDKLKAGFGLNLYNIDYGTNEYTANDPFFVNNDTSKSAIDMDFGVAYLVSTGFQMGFVSRNIFQTKLAIEADDALPREFGLGATYNIIPQWLIASDVTYNSYKEKDFNDFTYSLGTEYRLTENLAFRSGVNNNEMSFGLGLLVLRKEYIQKYRNPLNNREMINTKSIDLSLDYGFSYPLFSDLEIPYGNHFIGLEVKLGNSTTEEYKLASHIPPRVQREIIREPMKVVESMQPVSMDTLYIEVEKIIKDTIYVVDTLKVFTGISTDEYLRKSKELDAVRLELKDYKDLNEALIHITKATKYYYQSKLEEAVLECKAAIRLAPNMALAYIKLGSIYYRMGDSKKAYDNWKIAKAIDPNNPELKAVFKE